MNQNMFFFTKFSVYLPSLAINRRNGIKLTGLFFLLGLVFLAIPEFQQFQGRSVAEGAQSELSVRPGARRTGRTHP
jgi:hypothetical protein